MQGRIAINDGLKVRNPKSENDALGVDSTRLFDIDISVFKKKNY